MRNRQYLVIVPGKQADAQAGPRIPQECLVIVLGRQADAKAGPRIPQECLVIVQVLNDKFENRRFHLEQPIKTNENE